MSKFMKMQDERLGEKEEDINTILAYDISSLKENVEEFKEYWNRCEPNIPLEKAPKSDVIKYLFAYLKPQVSLKDREFYEGLFKAAEMMIDMKIPKNERRHILESMWPRHKLSSVQSKPNLSKVIRDTMGIHEILTPERLVDVRPVEGDNFTIEGPSPSVFGSQGVIYTFPDMRIDTGGKYIHNFFWDRGGDCYTYCLASYAMLRYFDLDTKVASFRPIVDNPQPKTKYTHYVNIIDLDRRELIFDPLYLRLNQTFPHKRKTYMKPNENLDMIIRLAKTYNTKSLDS